MTNAARKLTDLELEHELEKEDARERARNGILNFTTYTFPDYEVNWHHKATANFLNRWVAKEFRFGMIFEPPRHGKSELTSRRLPAYIHGRFPQDEILAGSYNSSLASDMCRDVQRIMDSPEYAELFPTVKITAEGQRSLYKRTNTEHEIHGRDMGGYKCAGVGGAFTGRGADWFIIDDPFKGRAEADSPAYRKQVWDWWISTVRKRLEKNGSVLLIMTRWHEDDLAGRLIEQMLSDPEADQWEILSLPALKEPLKKKTEAQALIEKQSARYDKRDDGTPLWPNKYNTKELRAIRLGDEREWQSLYQQMPTAQEGGIIKRDWFKTYTKLPDRFDEVIQSWDMSFKDTSTSDYVVGQVWGRKGADCYLLAELRNRMGFAATVDAVKLLTSQHPLALAKLVEDKANGPAVISALSSKIMGIIAVEPMGSKEARLQSVAPAFQAGNVYVPEPKLQPWVREYIEELVNFPTAKFDDRVDATSQALIRLISSASSVFSKQHIPKIPSISSAFGAS